MTKSGYAFQPTDDDIFFDVTLFGVFTEPLTSEAVKHLLTILFSIFENKIFVKIFYKILNFEVSPQRFSIVIRFDRRTQAAIIFPTSRLTISEMYSQFLLYLLASINQVYPLQAGFWTDDLPYFLNFPTCCQFRTEILQLDYIHKFCKDKAT